MKHLFSKRAWAALAVWAFLFSSCPVKEEPPAEISAPLREAPPQETEKTDSPSDRDTEQPPASEPSPAGDNTLPGTATDPLGRPVDIGALTEDEKLELLTASAWLDAFPSDSFDGHLFRKDHQYQYDADRAARKASLNPEEYAGSAGFWRFNENTIEVLLTEYRTANRKTVPVAEPEWETLGSLESLRIGIVQEVSGSVVEFPPRITFKTVGPGKVLDKETHSWRIIPWRPPFSPPPAVTALDPQGKRVRSLTEDSLILYSRGIGNLEEYLRLYSDEELAPVEFLNLAKNELTAIGGLERFPSLKKLNLSDNRLREIDLRKLPPALEELICINNPPEKTFTVNADLPALRRLDLQGCGITRIENFEALPPKMEYIELQNNPIENPWEILKLSEPGRVYFSSPESVMDREEAEKLKLRTQLGNYYFRPYVPYGAPPTPQAAAFRENWKTLGDPLSPEEMTGESLWARVAGTWNRYFPTPANNCGYRFNEKTFFYDTWDGGPHRFDSCGGDWRLSGRDIEIRITHYYIYIGSKADARGYFEIPEKARITVSEENQKWQTIGSAESIRLNIVYEDEQEGPMDFPPQIFLRTIIYDQLTEPEYFWQF